MSMTDNWAFTGGPPSTTSTTQVTLVEGRTFCVSDPTGDIGSTVAAQGLIVRDTRFLARYLLHIDGDPLEPLAVQSMGPHAATFVTRRRPRAGLADSTLLVVRRRYVGNGMVEDITVENVSREATAITAAVPVPHGDRSTSASAKTVTLRKCAS